MGRSAKAEGALNGHQVRFVRQPAEGTRRGRKHAWLGLILCSAGIVGLWGIGNFHPKIVRSIIEQHLAASNLTAGGDGE